MTNYALPYVPVYSPDSIIVTLSITVSTCNSSRSSTQYKIVLFAYSERRMVTPTYQQIISLENIIGYQLRKEFSSKRVSSSINALMAMHPIRWPDFYLVVFPLEQRN